MLSPSNPRRSRKSAAFRCAARSRCPGEPWRRTSSSRARAAQSSPPDSASAANAASIAAASRPWVASSARMRSGPWPAAARVRAKAQAKRLSSCQPACDMRSTAAWASSSAMPRAWSLRVSSCRECSRRTRRPKARWAGVLSGRRDFRVFRLSLTAGLSSEPCSSTGRTCFGATTARHYSSTSSGCAGPTSLGTNFSRKAVSSRTATAGFSLRYWRAFSLPCPILSSP